MAYEVTATRKRPQAFEKLVGQEFVVSTIENAIDSGRIAHAYLFSGPRGVGKTSSARLLAKALNCEKGPTAHPCGVCTSCKEITSGSSVDVIEIDGASNTSVNDIRVIKDEVLFPPQSSRYKIYIIDEVHMLSNSAFNALLKTIEEPPEYIIFIFATTELQKVPATIRSRCQQFHFQLIGLEDIKGCLAEAAQEMSIEADDDALFWIAKEATGSMRDAYTLFDQVASFSGNHITLQGIKDKLGLVGSDQIGEIISLSISGKRAEALAQLSSIIATGVSIEQCIKDFTDFFRALLFAKEGIKNEELLNMRYDDIPQSILNTLSVGQLEAALRTLLQIYREIRYSISPRFELELFISRLSSLPFLTSNEELVRKLSELKQNMVDGKVSVVKEKVMVQVAAEPAEVKKNNDAEAVEAPEQPIEAETETKEEIEESVSPIPLAYEDAEEETTPEAEPSAGNQIPTLSDIKEKLSSYNNWEIASSAPNLYEVGYSEEDGLVMKTEMVMASMNLNQNINVIKEALFSLGYSGRISIVVEKKPERRANEKIERLARAFRGNVIFEDDKKTEY